MKFRTHNKIHHMSQTLFLHFVNNVKQLSLSPFSLDNTSVYIGRLHWMHIGPYGEGAENGCGTAAHWRKTSLTSIPSRTRMDLILSTARSEPLMFILPSLSAIRGRRFSGSRAARFTPVSMTA